MTLGHAPSRCLVIEDAGPGIQAARTAGCLVIGVTNGGPAGELTAADLLVPALTRLQLRRDADGIALAATLPEPVPGGAR
jgi:sugar-phosphatase